MENTIDISKLTPEQVVQLAQQFSGFNDDPEYSGGDDPEYSGYDDPDVEFIGKSRGGSFFNMNDEQAFTLEVTNSSGTSKTLILSMGLDYLEGSETPGQLRAGTFPAENDTGTDTSLTAVAAIPGQSIPRLIRFTRQNPTIAPKVLITTDQPVAQLGLTNTITETGLLSDSPAKQIKWRKYADKNAFNLQFIELNEQLYFGTKWLIRIPIAGNSTITFDFYFGASTNVNSQLENRVNAAIQTASRNPNKVALTQARGKQAQLKGLGGKKFSLRG